MPPPGFFLPLYRMKEKKNRVFEEKAFSNGNLYDNIYLVFITTYNGKEDDIIWNIKL